MPRLTTRISRAFFGVLSIWCLGCTSLDVIIDRLVHGDDPSSGCVMADDAPVQSLDGGTRIQPSAVRSMAVGCGCDHCVAVESPAIAFAVPPQPTPETIELRLGRALSVDREPLVPPPIARELA